MMSKLPNTGTSIFSKMTALAQEYNAINVAQGFPDFEIDPLLPELVFSYSKKGYNQYAPMPGALPLRNEISKKTEKLYGTYFNPANEITITSGATQAIFSAICAFVHPGDEVIVFTPAYDSYVPSILLNQATVIEIPLMEENNFNIPWDMLKEKINTRTRLIIFNNPHNPCGKVFSKEDIETLADIIKPFPQLFLLSDEVYEHIVFDRNVFVPTFTHPELRNKTISVYSFGKTFHVTGWKTGYVLASPSLTEEFRKVHQFNVFSGNHPVQLAFAEYMSTYDQYHSISAMYEQKRNAFLEQIKNSAFTYTPTEGTYFQLLSYDAISNLDDIAFTEELVKEYNISTIPLSPFYYAYSPQKKFIRVCFAKIDETLKKASEKLKNPLIKESMHSQKNRSIII